MNSLTRVAGDQLTTCFGPGEVPQHVDAIRGQFLRGEYVLAAEDLLEPVQRRSDLLGSDPRLTECVEDMRSASAMNVTGELVATAGSDVDERLAALVSAGPTVERLAWDVEVTVGYGDVHEPGREPLVKHETTSILNATDWSPQVTAPHRDRRRLNQSCAL